MTIIKLGVSIAVPLLVGFAGSIATMPAIDGWYAELAKPALNPPSWVFGPVWTTLYVLMGVAAFLVWRHGLKRPDVQRALGLFAIQLAFNGVWSFLFFGLANPLWAFVDIVAMWIAIVLTIVYFFRISRPAAYLLIPYLAWVSFASYLNLMIIFLN